MHKLYDQYAQQQKDCSFFSVCSFELEYVATMINNHIFDIERTLLELEQIKNEIRKMKVNEEMENEIRRNSLLPARERLTAKQMAIRLNVSSHTIAYTKRRLGALNEDKPLNRIGKDEASIRSFLQEVDEAGFGNRKALADKYGFTSLSSLHTTASILRKKLNKVAN